MASFSPRSFIRSLALPLLFLAVVGGCKEPSTTPSETAADSILLDSVEAAADRIETAPSPRPADSAALRRRVDVLLSTANSLAERRPDSAQVLSRAVLRTSRVLGDSGRVAASLSSLGQTLTAQSHYEEALNRYRHALSIHRKRSHTDAVADVLNRIGHAHEYLSQYDAALDHYREALSLHRELENQEGVARTLKALGILHTRQGRYEEALNDWQTALSVQRERGNEKEVAKLLANMGILYKNQGRYENALSHYREALSIQRDRDANGDAAKVLTNMGVIHKNQGRYADALEAYREALAVHRDREDRNRTAATLNNIGMVYKSQGRYEKALAHYRESLSIKQEIGDQNGVANTLFNIGVVYRNQGRYQNALTNYRESLAIKREIGDRSSAAAALNDIGVVHRTRGRYDKALELHQEALSIKSELDDRDGVATTLHYIGDAHRQQAHLREALRHYRRSLQINREIGRPASVASNLEATGRIYLERGHVEAATDTLRQAVDLLESLRSNASSPEARRSLLSTEIESYRALTTAFVRAGAPDSALRSVEQARARLLADRLAGTARGDTSFAVPAASTLRATVDSNEAALLYANTGTQHPLTALVVTQDSTYARDLPASAFRTDAGRRYADPLDRLRRKDGPLVDALGEDAFSPSADLPSLAEVIRLYRHHLTATDAPDSIQTDLSHRLHELLLAPLQDRIRDKTTLTVVPTGPLGYLPLDVLRDSSGTHLIEKHHVRYAPSLTVLRQLQERTYDAPERPLLAVGGADYGGSPSDEAPVLTEARGTVDTEEQAATLLRTAERRREAGKSQAPTYETLGYDRWPPLLGAKLEVQKLRRALGDETTVLTGQNATEERLRQMNASGRLATYRRIHFATHGIAAPATPALSALVLSQSTASDSVATRDGYLTMREIAELDLQADVAVLSACQTALGRIIAGEGIVGLSHAFLRAGANATLVSQWRVQDWSTQQFITSVYRRTNEGLPFAEAVTEVKRAFIDGTFGERNTDPLRWAPFIYYGHR